MKTLIIRYIVLSALVFLLSVQLGLVAWTLIRFSQIEHWSPGIHFFGNEIIDTKGLTKSAVSNLQEGTWFHLIRVRQDGGIAVEQIVAGSPADKAGLQSGDLIVSINGIDLKSYPEAYFQSRLGSNPGDSFDLVWHRDGRLYTGTLTLEKKDRVLYAIVVNQQELVMDVGAMTWFQRGPFLVFPIVLLGFGAWMGFRSPHNPIAFYCALMFLATALSSTHAFHPMIAGWPDWIFSVSIFAIETATITKAIFILRVLSLFPSPTAFGTWLQQKLWHLVSLLIVWTTCRQVYLFGLTYGWNNELVRFISGIVEPIPDPTLPLLIVILAGCLLLAQRSAARRQQRLRLHVIEIGCLSALIIAPMWAIIQPGTQLAVSEYIPIQGWGLPLIVWFLDSIVRVGLQCALPLSFAYAILAYRVFGLRFAFGKSLKYIVNNQGANLILCFGIFTVLYILLSVWPVDAITSDLLVACTAAGLTLILLGGWTQVKIPAIRFMDRYLFSEEFESPTEVV